MSQKSSYKYRDGFVDGIPIGLGYLSVSFGFGITASILGIPTLASLLISMTNLTSAGQLAGVSIIAASGTVLEMVLTQLVINMRYALMGLSLTQRLDSRFSTFHRFFTAFGITDEIFAVAVSKDEFVSPSYMYGLMTPSIIGWSLGTLLGAIAGDFLPAAVISALGILIYGMFVAIVVPKFKEGIGIVTVVMVAATVSCIIKFVPFLGFISSGFSIIISAVTAAVTASLLFPVKQEEEKDE